MLNEHGFVRRMLVDFLHVLSYRLTHFFRVQAALQRAPRVGSLVLNIVVLGELLGNHIVLVASDHLDFLLKNWLYSQTHD